MDQKLLEILVCPLCNSKLSLSRKNDALICKFDRLSFAFDEGLPVLLPEAGQSLTASEMEAIIKD